MRQGLASLRAADCELTGIRLQPQGPTESRWPPGTGYVWCLLYHPGSSSFLDGSQGERMSPQMRKNAADVLGLVATLTLVLCPAGARVQESEWEWATPLPQGNRFEDV